jgi:hypothetical protein
MTSDFLKRKMAEYEALQAEITALQADMKAQRAAVAKKSAH